MKDKDTRKSKGVAFILFLDKESAQNCSRALNNKQVSYGKFLWLEGWAFSYKTFSFSFQFSVVVWKSNKSKYCH